MCLFLGDGKPFGVKERCALSTLSYYDWAECLTLDSCHTIRRILGHLVNVWKSNTAFSPWSAPENWCTRLERLDVAILVTENGRECITCGKYLPWTNWYKKQWEKPDHPCKLCLWKLISRELTAEDTRKENGLQCSQCKHFRCTLCYTVSFQSKNKKDRVCEVCKADNVHAAKVNKWKINVQGHESVGESLCKLQLTVDGQRSADQCYRWAAMPGFSQSHGSIFEHQGDIDIHDALELMSSDLLLYCVYAYCDYKFYLALTGFIEIWSKIIDPSETPAQLQNFKPQFKKSMSMWEEVAPVNCLGTLYHATKHIFDARADGSAEHERWMFMFERFVSYLVSKTRSRSYPETSCANEMAEIMFLDHTDTVDGIPSEELKSQSFEEMLGSLSMIDKNKTKQFGPAKPPFTIPKRLREYRQNLTELDVLLDACTDKGVWTHVFRRFVETSGDTCDIYDHCMVDTMEINGESRCLVKNEPAIGNVESCIRKSGFKCKPLEGNEPTEWAGQLVSFLIVNKTELFVMARLLKTDKCFDSKLTVSELTDCVLAIIPYSCVGQYVVFCPWRDRLSKKIVLGKFCVLQKKLSTVDTHST